MALRPAITTSRRLRNSATMAFTSSCGPASAAMPARCTNDAVHEVELFMSVAMCLASGSFMMPKPSRQPVMA
jgi:hypothetical protein